MATNNTPRGLVLAKKNGSGSNSTGIDTIDWEAETTVPSSGLSTDMFTGDPIIAYASSSVKPSPADASDKCIGVFQGCSFVNSSGEQKFSRHWTGGTTATDIKIFVSNSGKMAEESRTLNSSINSYSNKGILSLRNFDSIILFQNVHRYSIIIF